MFAVVLPFCIVVAGGAFAVAGIAQNDTTRAPLLALAAALVVGGIVLGLVA